MARWGHPRLIGAVALALAGIACGGAGGPGSPTPPGSTSSGNSCRTYPTNASVTTTTTASNITFNALETGAFDSSTKKSTVTTVFTNGALCSVLVTSYNSVADFVDEVRVIPGVFLSTANVNTNSGACGTGTASNTFTYDAQRRLTQVTNTAGGVTTYTAWDSAGRPTTGSTNGGLSITSAYDDAARTVTQTQVASNGTRTVSTQTFDADGAQLRMVVVEGNVTTTTTFTNTTTAKVCK